MKASDTYAIDCRYFKRCYFQPVERAGTAMSTCVEVIRAKMKSIQCEKMELSRRLLELDRELEELVFGKGSEEVARCPRCNWPVGTCGWDGKVR